MVKILETPLNILQSSLTPLSNSILSTVVKVIALWQCQQKPKHCKLQYELHWFMRIILKCCHHTEPIIHREVQPRKQMKGKFLNVCLQKETMVCLFELRPQILQLAGSCSCLNPHTIKLVQVLCSPVHLCCYLKDESVCEFAFVTSSLTFKDRFTFSICLYLYTILTLLHIFMSFCLIMFSWSRLSSLNQVDILPKLVILVWNSLFMDHVCLATAGDWQGSRSKLLNTV